MHEPISIIGLEASEIPVFIESLSREEQKELIQGESRLFDEPLEKILENLSREEKVEFIISLLDKLPREEKVMLLETKAFDGLYLSEDDFEKIVRVAYVCC